MKTNSQARQEAKELTAKFKVLGLSENRLSEIIEKELVRPYIAPFSRSDTTPIHGGYEYFLEKGEITKEVWSNERKRFEFQTKPVTNLKGKVTWGSSIGHCTKSWYAYLLANETGTIDTGNLSNLAKSGLYAITLGKYKPATIASKKPIGSTISSDNEKMILPACYEFALQRVTGNKNIKVEYL